jgi:tRNA A37 threonylcarbamoyladenosine synthetase subunit TsaC/SUA5/YrdC
VTGPRLIGARRSDEALAALAADQVIAVPGDGGYLLAARHDLRDTVARLDALGLRTVGPTPLQLVVGRREQAVALASVWTKETAILTDRMWPGPLTVIVPALLQTEESDPVLAITMPSTRALRRMCRESEPLMVCALQRPHGAPLVDPAEVEVRLTASDVALIVDGGVCRGPGPTVVDCRMSPPVVSHVGALPESYVDAALMMGNRRRRLFTRRSKPDT